MLTCLEASAEPAYTGGFGVAKSGGYHKGELERLCPSLQVFLHQRYDKERRGQAGDYHYRSQDGTKADFQQLKKLVGDGVQIRAREWYSSER